MKMDAMQCLWLSYEHHDERNGKVSFSVAIITDDKRYDFGYLQVALFLSRNDIFHCHFQMCTRFHPWLYHICIMNFTIHLYTEIDSIEF